MPDQDRCKADKHDSLFVTYTIIDPTFTSDINLDSVQFISRDARNLE